MPVTIKPQDTSDEDYEEFNNYEENKVDTDDEKEKVNSNGDDKKNSNIDSDLKDKEEEAKNDYSDSKQNETNRIEIENKTNVNLGKSKEDVTDKNEKDYYREERVRIFNKQEDKTKNIPTEETVEEKSTEKSKKEKKKTQEDDEKVHHENIDMNIKETAAIKILEDVARKMDEETDENKRKESAGQKSAEEGTKKVNKSISEEEGKKVNSSNSNSDLQSEGEIALKKFTEEVLKDVELAKKAAEHAAIAAQKIALSAASATKQAGEEAVIAIKKAAEEAAVIIRTAANINKKNETVDITVKPKESNISGEKSSFSIQIKASTDYDTSKNGSNSTTSNTKSGLKVTKVSDDFAVKSGDILVPVINITDMFPKAKVELFPTLDTKLNLTNSSSSGETVKQLNPLQKSNLKNVFDKNNVTNLITTTNSSAIEKNLTNEIDKNFSNAELIALVEDTSSAMIAAEKAANKAREVAEKAVLEAKKSQDEAELASKKAIDAAVALKVAEASASRSKQAASITTLGDKDLIGLRTVGIGLIDSKI